MPIPPSLNKSAGKYKGKSSLQLFPGDPIKECESTLEVSLHQEYACVTYAWVDPSNKPQQGHIIISTDKDKSEASWLDSWHMSFPIMNLKGTAEPLRFTGSYSGGNETWGWRIELTPNDAGLHFEMTNIAPDGQEAWAVRADYQRV